MENNISSVRVFFNETSKTLNVVIPNADVEDIANVKKFLSATVERITGITDNGIETDEILANKSESMTNSSTVFDNKKEVVSAVKTSAPTDAEIAKNPIPEDDGIDLGLLGAKPISEKVEMPISNEVNNEAVIASNVPVDGDVYEFDFGMHQGKKILDFVNASNAESAYNYLAFILEKNFKKVAEKKDIIIRDINIATKNLFDSGFTPNEKCAFEMARTFLYCLPTEKVEQVLALEGYGSIKEAIDANNNEWFSQIVSVYKATI